MPTSAIPQFDVIGDPPKIEGRICEALICQNFVYQGTVESTANATFLKFDGQWYRLCFELYAVIWRRYNDEPKSWRDEETSCEHQMQDVGTSAGVVGVRLEGYEVESTSESLKVTLIFEGGRKLIIEDMNEATNYAVI